MTQINKWPWTNKTVLDIDAKLHKTRNRIYRVGVELEGGWTKLPEGVSALIPDGSVQFPVAEAYNQTQTRRILEVGELPSPTLILESKKAEDLTLEKWLSSHYPQKVNSSCGMHVHMSFQNAFQYQRLMVEEYMWTIGEYIRRWGVANQIPLDHPLWNRLAGNSTYCTFNFYPDVQAQNAQKRFHHDNGNRYTVIHYCFTRLGTIECRLLPMFDNWVTSLSAIREVLAITSAFLVTTTSKRETPFTDGWTAESDPAYNEFLEVTV
jgi:hypothetical protein